MSYEITGRIVAIENEKQVNDRFKTREFTIETKEEINSTVYTNYAKFQTVQAKCDLLNRYSIGEDVTVSFNVKGNRWERDGKVNYITNLDAWKIQSAATNTPSDYSNVAKDNTGVVTNSPSQAEPPKFVPNEHAGDSLPF